MTRREGRPRVIVVGKRSALSHLEDGVVDHRARRLLKEGHEAVRKWRLAHEDHERTLERVSGALEKLGAEVLLLQGAHAAFDPRGTELIVTVGGDGTLLAASHSIKDVPILGINSAPRFSVGFFCAATAKTAPRMLAAALEGQLGHVELARMQVSVAGQVRATRVLNEALFAHSEPAATSTYILQVGRRREDQKSSGLWVGPAAGSTAALLSAGGQVLPLTAQELQFVVREPFMGDGRRYRLTQQVLGPRHEVVVVSKMHAARVYLDGPYRAIDVRLGDEVRFSRSSESLRLLGLDGQRSMMVQTSRK